MADNCNLESQRWVLKVPICTLFYAFMFESFHNQKSKERKEVAEERKGGFSIHSTALSFRVVWHCMSDETSSTRRLQFKG